jgi:hypothetical protein
MSGLEALMKRLMSAPVWLWLNRATILDPSDKRSCSEVVG